MLGVQLMNVWTETSARHASLASALSEEYASLEKRIEDDLAREAHAERLKQRREKSAQRRQFALRRGSPRLGGDILGKDLMLNRELSEDEESASESDGAQLLTTVNSERDICLFKYQHAHALHLHRRDPAERGLIFLSCVVRRV